MNPSCFNEIKLQRVFRKLGCLIPIGLECKDVMLFGECRVVFDFAGNTVRYQNPITERKVAVLDSTGPKASSIRAFEGKVIGQNFEITVVPCRFFRNPSIAVTLSDLQTNEIRSTKITNSTISSDYLIFDKVFFHYNGMNDVSLNIRFERESEVLALVVGSILLSHIIDISPLQV